MSFLWIIPKSHPSTLRLKTKTIQKFAITAELSSTWISGDLQMCQECPRPSEGRSTHIERSSDAGVERKDISLKICQNAKNLKKKKQISSNI